MHIGPISQDFNPLFEVGKDDKTISTIDPAGVALVVIQEVYRIIRRIDEKGARINMFEERLTELQKQVPVLMTDRGWRTDDGKGYSMVVGN